MSQIPSDPDTNRRNRQSLTYDELIALFVAFLTLGSVLFWGLTRSGVNLFGNAGMFSGEGAPPLIGGLDQNSRLGADNDFALGADSTGKKEDIGFGAADALGAAGAGSIVRDPDRATTTKVPTPVALPNNRTTTSQPTSAASTTVPVNPKPPQQAAQPAAPEVAPVTAPVAPPLAVTQTALKFSDVPDGYWAKPYIDALSERDVFDGIIVDGVTEGETFKPDEPISRAQLARAITKAFPLSQAEAAIAFSDVAADNWATEFINEAVKGGYMNGFPDKSFKPELSVPRVQALTAMVTGSNATIQEDAAAVIQRYSDAADIPTWAIPKVAAATQSSLVVNHPSLEKLNPNQPATRAEVAAMIYQTLVAQGRIDPLDGEYVVQP